MESVDAGRNADVRVDNDSGERFYDIWEYFRAVYCPFCSTSLGSGNS